ncbi:MAG: PEP-CTERM sorting domain-containing protein [Pseudomonadota bacterium]|nr:PEP-CTERM sorting domain-containing protein [Pseudomonadota bacterium]
MRIRHHLLGFVLAMALPAANATVFSLDTTIGSGNDPIAASADFVWSGSTLELRLTNDTAGISKTIQELTGITFILSGSPTLQASGVSGSAAGSVNCIGIGKGDSCAIDHAAVNPFGTPPDLASAGTPPTGWAALPSYALFTFGAGGGSWKPYGIVNDTVVGTGSNGNTSNPEHNPMLLGPVTFDFRFNEFAMTPTITGVEFYWGTGGEHRTGSRCTTEACVAARDSSVPEPQTLALLGLALFAMAAFRRKQRA